ncbi:arginyl-tRNA---protein transferase [Geosmithia morbida]|uniref:arginyltransferase n=1 Tax=Geosmithia morbida TaxID=1094350 RepID=A0A9P4YZQ1_9HYPO|nr:arginyl-tRNA---protein transferase [Geosmithia morbida]KAF4125895.1 arginyl-tRNA---protein transferase [Geosmithia morbida]
MIVSRYVLPFLFDLLDRCWRRSGKLLYRPDQRRSCCPHYTIRLDSYEFKPSRTQRQTANRFNKFVIGQDYASEAARLHPRTKEESRKRNNDFVLSERIHEAEYSNLKTPPEPAHKLVITLEEDNFTEEKFQVYDNYQARVHHEAPEDRSRRSFSRFLCSSPLRRQTMIGPDGKQRRLGSYHQCYRLDGKLAAVGVLDLLPDCVSSVYFFYDESIHAYMPGKLGALHEISLAYEDGYRWWYPGFYIHNCPKMRYKIDYAPQYILDPETLHWDPLDQAVLNLLDEKPFVSLYIERHKTLANEAAGGHPSTSKTAKLNGSGDEVSTDGQSVPPDSSNTKGDNKEDEDGDDDDDHSLFRSKMPGLPSMSYMQSLDLNHIALKRMRTGPLYETSNLVGWDSSSISKWPSIKAGVAELVAALGTDCVDVLCLDLTRGGD